MSKEHEYRIFRVWFPKSDIPTRLDEYFVKSIKDERKRIIAETGHKTVRIDFEEVDTEIK